MGYSGRCLCGDVQFRVNTEIQRMYHCHCSLCRKQSGTAANAATLVNQQNFEWIAGIFSISWYQKDTGFRSHFCQRCGSPVPNLVGTTTFIWIPLGLLDTAPAIQQKFSFCLSDQVAWTSIPVDQTYAVLPAFEILQAYFEHEP